MNTINKVLDVELLYMMSTYIVDGVCIKSRLNYPELVDAEEATRRVEHFENIAIQVDNRTTIYCDTQKETIIKDLLMKNERVLQAYDEGRLIINTHKGVTKI